MLAIQKIQIALRPAHERDEDDRPAVRRCRDAEDVLLGTPLAEDELIARGIGAQTVEANAPVVVLVGGGHGSRRGMNCVVEPAVAAYPRDRASLGLRDPVCEWRAGRGLDHEERRHLVAAARESVRDAASLRR